MYGLYIFQNNFFKPNTRTKKRALTRAQKRSTRTRTRTLRIQGKVTTVQIDTPTLYLSTGIPCSQFLSPL